MTGKSIKNLSSEKIINYYTLFLSISFLMAVPFAVLITGEMNFFDNLVKIITSPSKLVTDYFALGGLGSTFFNAAICGFIVNLLIFITRIKSNSTTFAGYMLVVAHGFYGLNFINMLPLLFGIFLYCKITKRKFAENLHLALFATALSPFISEFLFRYPLDSLHSRPFSPIGILLSAILGILAGFVIPALVPGTTHMHRGFNLYKAGLAIGIFGIFVNALIYASFGFRSPETIVISNPEYYSLPFGYRGFMNGYFIILFVITGLLGVLLNKDAIKEYKKLIKSTGYGTSFSDKFGMPVCLINISVYGLLAVAFLNIVFVLPNVFQALPSGVGFTGASVGVVFAALTFSLDGQQPRTVAPIVVGYIILFIFVSIVCTLLGIGIPWSLSDQSYINGLAFATGLCPIAGKYGFKYGVIAGFLSAVICTVTSSMHGGFVLYNGGFTAGLAALVLIPVFDFYNINPKYEDDV